MVKKAVVTVKEGKVCGIKTKSEFSGVEYYAFYGVPYGQPTSNNARFKDPIKVKPWKHVLDATTQKDGCLQFSIHLQSFSGTEDCLYNNIYTPKLPSKDNSLKPVIFCIHPGGYFHGSPDPWYYGSPEYVMHRDIVYVCVGYRLHFLGFLNLGLEECSGNQGIKDIILSLKWIKENISVFGGDPENITLLGSSSGSSIVHHLMLSPAARGLFHKAIMMGIYNFDPTLLIEEDHVELADKLARTIGYEAESRNDRKKLLSFYKKIKMDEVSAVRLERVAIQDSAALFPCSPFAPTIDHGKNAVLPAPLKELMVTTPRIPLLFGICDKEAAMALTSPMRKATLENFYTAYTQSPFGWGRGMDKNEIEIIAEKIRSFYLNGEPIETAPLSLQIDILTDMAYSDVYDTVINFISADLPSSVFVYKFEFEGNATTMKDKLKILFEVPLEGTCHAADFSYWACIRDHYGIKSEILNQKTTEMVHTFTKLISTFAETGNPNHNGLNVAWMPSTPENPCYLSINEELQLIEGKLNGKRMEFWENVKKEFRKN